MNTQQRRANAFQILTKERDEGRANQLQQIARLKQAVAILSQPVATNQDFDGRDYKYAYTVLKSDVESARAILNVEIGKASNP